MLIYINSTILPESTDTLVAETNVGNQDVKVYRDADNSYWVSENEKLINTAGLNAEQVIEHLIQMLETAMLRGCTHK